MKPSIIFIAMTISSTLAASSKLNSSALNGCIRINAALAAQVADISQISDQISSGIVSDQCQNLLDLADSLNGVISGVTDQVISLTSGGLLGGLGLGNLLGGLLNTVQQLLASVLSLVTNLVGNLLQTTCGVADDVLSQLDGNQLNSKDLANINICFNPQLSVLINVATGAYTQLNATQAQIMAQLMNSVCASTSSNVQPAVSASAIANANAGAKAN